MIEGIRTLTDFLTTDEELEELNAGSCDLDGYGVEAFADTLETNKGLKEFSVNSNCNSNCLGGIFSPSRGRGGWSRLDTRNAGKGLETGSEWQKRSQTTRKWKR